MRKEEGEEIKDKIDQLMPDKSGQVADIVKFTLKLVKGILDAYIEED